MADTAVLGFEVDSSGAVRASSDLDRLTASANKVDQAADRASASASKMSRGFADISPELQRIIQGLEKLGTSTNSIDRTLASMAKQATQTATSTKDIGTAATEAARQVDTLNEKLKRVGDGARSFGDQSAHVRAYRDEIERLTNQYKPLDAAQKQYDSNITNIQRLQKLNILNATEAAAAIDKERLALDRLSKAQSQVQSGSGGISSGHGRAAAINLAFQGQDIFSTALTGASAKTVALQQGPQVAGALAGMSAKEAGGALVGAAQTLLSPVSIASIALTGLAASAIQYFANSTSSAKSLNDVLTDNAKALDALKERYGALADVQVSPGNVGGNTFILAQANKQREDLRKSMKSELSDYLSSTVNAGWTKDYLASNGLSSVERLKNLSGDQANFAGPVFKLLEGVRNGHGDLEKFNQDVDDLARNLAKTADHPEAMMAVGDAVKAIASAGFDASGKYKDFADAFNLLKVKGVDGFNEFSTKLKEIGDAKGLSKQADEALALGEKLVTAAQQAALLDKTLKAIALEDTRPGLRDRDALRGYVARRSVGERQVNEQFAAEQLSMRARTFAERQTAARAQSLAQRPANMDEGGGATARADRAVQLERVRQEMELRDAAQQRAISLKQMIEDQQTELALVGQTGGAAAGLRKEFELISQLRQEAAKNGTEVDQKEIDLIKQKTAEYAKYVDLISQAKFKLDMDRQVSDAHLDPRSRQIVQTQRQYGMTEDVNSASGQRIGQQYDWQQAKDMAKGFGSAFSNELISGSHNIGKAFLKGLQSSLENEASKLWEKFFDSLGNIFADLITGTKGSGGSAGAGGVVGSVAAAAFGGKAAANNNAPGGYSGLAASGVGQALGFVGNYKSGVDPRLTDILNTAATKFPGYKVDAMSGFRAGDPRFHGKGLATDVQLTDLANGKLLGNYQHASSFSQYEKFAQTARAVQMEKYPELADQFRWGGYFGGPKGKYGAVDQMHFDLGGAGMAGGSWQNGLTAQQMAMFPGIQSQGMGSAVDAVNKLAGASTDAATNLTSFGGGLGKLGQSLTSAFPAAPSAPPAAVALWAGSAAYSLRTSLLLVGKRQRRRPAPSSGFSLTAAKFKDLVLADPTACSLGSRTVNSSSTRTRPAKILGFSTASTRVGFQVSQMAGYSPAAGATHRAAWLPAANAEMACNWFWRRRQHERSNRQHPR